MTDAPKARPRKARRPVLELLGSAFLHLLGRSWRFEREGVEHFQAFRDRGEPVIFLFWHSRILPLAHLHRNEGAVVLISEHRDGELIARLVERRGFGTARGSSTRGGSRGLRGLLRALRNGHDLAITPDGPKGPPRRLKLGALVAAERSGAPLIPLSVGARRAWRVRSWDRFLVPHPFARIQVVYGPPVHVPRGASREEFVEIASRVDAELNRLTDLVDVGNPDPVRPDTPWTPLEADA